MYHFRPSINLHNYLQMQAEKTKNMVTSTHYSLYTIYGYLRKGIAYFAICIYTYIQIFNLLFKYKNNYIDFSL